MLSWLGCFPFFANCVPFPVFSPCWKEAAGTVGVAERQGMPSRVLLPPSYRYVGTSARAVSQHLLHTFCAQTYARAAFKPPSGFTFEGLPLLLSEILARPFAAAGIAQHILPYPSHHFSYFILLTFPVAT